MNERAANKCCLYACFHCRCFRRSTKCDRTGKRQVHLKICTIVHGTDGRHTNMITSHRLQSKSQMNIKIRAKIRSAVTASKILNQDRKFKMK